MASPRLSREAYAIGIICALFEEKAAVEAMLDERHEALDQKREDTNSYTFGKIGKHNVVIACLPGGFQGTAAAATVAIHMTHSFPIKLGLMVGIGGGVPSQVSDIRLGDVVVSLPVGTHGGVIQYDFGKMELDGFRRKGHLNKPPKALLSAVTSLRAKHELDEPDFPEYLIAISKKPRMAKKYGFQGSENDQLFDNNDQRVIRDPREDDSPQVFYGTIGSGNMVMKDGEFRDLKAADDKIICFEMEAAGLMNDFPCLVIRGISDYADSHKNDRWQPYAAATAAAYAKELLSAVSVQEVEKLGPARKHLVPFSLKGIPAIDHFVNRDEDMQKLEDFFLSQTSHPVRRKVFVVHGLGGIGKTQLCVEFARKHQARYTAVLWMDGSSEDALQQSFVDLFPMLPSEEMPAGLVQAVRCQQASADLVVKGVLDWLSLPSNQRWLYIIDNVDHDVNTKHKDPSAYDWKKYSAQVDHGSLLITSRLSTLTVPQNAHRLTEMNPNEARALFEDHRGKPVSGQPARDESKDLESLLGKLEGMPLALAQAGAYIRQTNMSICEYLDYYNSTWDDLITKQDSYPLQEYAQRSMLTTWTISYQRVESRNREAASLLKLWAFLDPKDIWYELIACAIETGSEIDIPEWLSTLTRTRLEFRDALGLLKKYSLVNNGRDNDNYSMHAVLHSWCRHLASMSSASESFPELAVSIVTQMLPDKNDKDYGALWRRLFPHGQQLLYHLRLGTAWRLSRVPLGAYEKAATLFSCNQAYEEAAEVLRHALREKENTYGKDHPKTIYTVHQLAHSYDKLEKHEESQQLSERALAIYEKLLVSQPGQSVLIVEAMTCSLVSIGINFSRQNKLEDAEVMYKRALALSEQHQVMFHNSALKPSLQLGELYVNQARLEEAERMFSRALYICCKVWGVHHSFTLGLLARISDTFHYDIGRILNAMAIFDRAAAGFNEIILDDDHPSIKIASQEVQLLERQGKLAQAEELAKRVLSENEERMGPEHPDTLKAAFELASLYGYQDNRLQEAMTMFERLITKLGQTSGLHDHLSLKAKSFLGCLYANDLHMLSKAEELFEEVIAEREKLLGPSHSHTLKAVYNLGVVYKRQERKVRAAEMRQRILLACKNTLETEQAARVLRVVPGHAPGEFSSTSRDIMLDGNYRLVASCKGVDGSWLESSILLNNILENQGGQFAWNIGGNFVATARKIMLKDGAILAAELADEHGTWKDASVHLDERITNHNGELTFVTTDSESGPATSLLV
ncbi:purine and uridine phosphorylase, partial [Aureobasidium melanogenum]